eukprot:3935637-Prymnesium_polylepis.1
MPVHSVASLCGEKFSQTWWCFRHWLRKSPPICLQSALRAVWTAGTCAYSGRSAKRRFRNRPDQYQAAGFAGVQGTRIRIQLGRTQAPKGEERHRPPHKSPPIPKRREGGVVGRNAGQAPVACRRVVPRKVTGRRDAEAARVEQPALHHRGRALCRRRTRHHGVEGRGRDSTIESTVWEAVDEYPARLVPEVCSDGSLRGGGSATEHRCHL